MSRDVHSCTHWLRPSNSPPPPRHLDSYYEGAIGQQRLTTSLCDPLVVLYYLKRRKEAQAARPPETMHSDSGSSRIVCGHIAARSLAHLWRKRNEYLFTNSPRGGRVMLILVHKFAPRWQGETSIGSQSRHEVAG
jgi:hypothetical protein